MQVGEVLPPVRELSGAGEGCHGEDEVRAGAGGEAEQATADDPSQTSARLQQVRLKADQACEGGERVAKRLQGPDRGDPERDQGGGQKAARAVRPSCAGDHEEDQRQRKAEAKRPLLWQSADRVDEVVCERDDRQRQGGERQRAGCSRYAQDRVAREKEQSGEDPVEERVRAVADRRELEPARQEVDRADPVLRGRVDEHRPAAEHLVRRAEEVVVMKLDDVVVICRAEGGRRLLGPEHDQVRDGEQ